MNSIRLIFITLSILSCSTQHSEQEVSAFLGKLNILILKKTTIMNNIVNVSTTRTEKGGPYIPLDAINCQGSSCDIVPLKMTGVGADKLKKREPILKYEPNHPDVNRDGYVAYPNINVDEEKLKLERIKTAISFLLKTMPVNEKFFFSEEAQKFMVKFPHVDKEFNFKKLLGE